MTVIPYRYSIHVEKAFCILFLIIVLAGPSYTPSPGYGASVVGNIEIHGLHVMGEEELLYLLDISTGEPVDETMVRNGIKRAFLKGVFEDIAVEVLQGETETVVIHVKERRYIKDISLEGDYALSRKTIASLLPLQEDQYLSCDTIDKSLNTLRGEFALRGYPNALLEADIEESGTFPQVVVRLKVNTGRPVLVKRIIATGMSEDAKSVMRTSEGDVFDQIAVRKDLERIKKYYKEGKYFNPVVHPYLFEDGVLTITVEPGKRLFVSLDGNEALSAKVLLREMPFFEAEDFNNDIVEEAIQRMLTLYHEQGFPFAQIAPVISEEGNLIHLTFFIFEGKKVKTGEISFEGSHIEEDRLKSVLTLREGNVFDPDLIDSDRDNLTEFYFALGYLSVSVEDFQTQYDENSQTMKILLKIQEGNKTTIRNIKISGCRNVAEDEVRKGILIKPGDPYNEVDISDTRYGIIEFYGTKGFPSADVSVSRTLEGLAADITFTVDEGPYSVFGKAIVTGNNKTEYIVIRRELARKENVPFDYTILRKDRQGLYKLGLFSDVTVEMLEGFGLKRDVLINLHEANAGAVEFGLGYSDYEHYRGFLDVSYRNLWGMHRQASARTELSSLERRLILQYYEPWFVSGRTALRALFLTEFREELNVDTRETRYKLTRNAVSAGLERKFNSRIKSELYYEFSLVNTYDVAPDVVLSKEDTGTLVISGLRLGVVYDSRNDPFYPSRGILSGISAKLTSPAFLSESDFYKLSIYGNVYHGLARGLVLALSLRGGVAKGYGATAELPIVERFFLGGRTTVRGYEQDTLGPRGADGNPTGGNAFLMESLEMRISLGKGIGIVTFLDGGNVWVEMNDINPSDSKFTGGIGLRYDTPVGPLRVDYGHKLQREKDESSGELHFSIGHAF